MEIKEQLKEKKEKVDLIKTRKICYKNATKKILGKIKRLISKKNRHFNQQKKYLKKI